MEVRCIAGQNDHSSGRIRFQFRLIEFISKPDVEDAGNDGVNAILGVFVRLQFHTARHSDPYHVRSRLRWLTDKNGKPDRRRKSGEGLPVDVFAQDSLERGFARLMRSKGFMFCFYGHCVLNRKTPVYLQCNSAASGTAFC